MSNDIQKKSESLQNQIDELKQELLEIKDFMIHVSTEAQSVVFDECKIEKVIINQQDDAIIDGSEEK